MNGFATRKLDAACRTIAEKLVPPMVRVQTTDVPERHALARNDTPVSQSGKTKPRSPHPRRWALAPRQLTAINLLISGSSVAQAARTLGIGRRTLFRWLTDPVFRAELDARERHLSARFGTRAS